MTSENLLISNDPNLRKQFINYLANCVYEKRINQFIKVLDHRTRYITVVLEDIYQSQNASAVLRTCDCLGIQDIHIIENRNNFTVNPDVVLGASKWLNLYRYKGDDSSKNAIKSLKSDGYRIVATTPHANDISLEDYDLSKGKFALVFGTELTGLSPSVMSEADEFVRIPMFGFTESFNISVSAAIMLYALTSRLRNSQIDYFLSGDEKEKVLLAWLKTTTKSWRLLEKRFLQEHNLI